MNIAVTGSTGLVGSAVANFLQQHNNTITHFCRPAANRQEDESTKFWNTTSGEVSVTALEGHDCIIHLAGENIASKRWTPEYKGQIFNSRVKGTRVLSQSLAKMHNPPKLFISASAVGIYGNRSALEELDESASHGNDFLADVCAQWERATKPASHAGIRVCFLRFGVVLSKKGGALAKMLLPFKMGIGGRVGLGKQVISWIALDEIPLIINHVINNEAIEGPINCVSPKPVTNAEFSKILAKTLHRPCFFPMPSPMVKLLFGEMGEALLLGGQKVLPQKLLDSGYHFQYPSLQETLDAILKEA